MRTLSLTGRGLSPSRSEPCALSLTRTMKRLLDKAGGMGPCPACSGRPHVTVREGQEIPTCPVCNRALPVLLVVRDDNFYGNAEKLRQIADRGE
jgi:hypothetical protein